MLTTALSDMARVMTTPGPPNSTHAIPVSATTGISPGKIANLRTNYLQQLRDLHSLLENGAISDKEFQELKVPIVQQLKKLNQC